MVKFNIAQVNEVMWTYLADKATVHESLTEQKKTLTSSDRCLVKYYSLCHHEK